ncbi:Bis(5'-nucleosyl)-tetraphosphatase PrpE [asymmetrical] [Defluviimonas aquaemixtae]|uniref:Bis(5'-nucleosyl)-tetraphosphatase PrpE [asymmetrical] n=1 Tax=Albidovulum aquaemixtae TaxID=1542388 RepID=A0A2R8BKW5_9RHOB|nr:metallophosphoesterase [Defluviimonas aquaemixtae]SPH24070.1 Bis(5'-nucleosyl)-tetraphosphatase PrpE [asymmetrical] [Defluviimonas aquaemixtae]
MRIYAVGDVHGHLDKLAAAHQRIAADRERVGDTGAPVVHIGDLVDRGPDSRGVIEHLIRGQEAGENWVVLKGNHDRMFELFLADPDNHDPGLRAHLHWVSPNLGGAATLASYGVEAAGERTLFDIHETTHAAVPERHAAFLRDLPIYWVADGVVFVHAGIRPGVPLAEQAEDDLLWIRDEFLNDTRDHGALIVHGHTPIEAVTHYGNRVNIDTGAGYGRALSAVVIEDGRAWLLAGEGRLEIPPLR